MAANNVSNIHVSLDVLSTLMLLQQGKLHNLQQQILHEISRSSRLGVLQKKLLLKLTQNSYENTCIGVSF